MTSPDGADSAMLLTPVEVDEVRRRIDSIREPLRRVLLGKEDLIDLVLVGFLARGHMLLEGLPGLGKTELVKALGRLLSLEFRRIQFTPDLLPGDILGSPILEENAQGRRELVFHKGPIFGNIILADEINRASPKTQSAMLEAMQERKVTVLGQTHSLPEPFYVLATQNPIELEGTYPLPEAQLDRFTFKVSVTGVGEEVLSEIVRTRPHGSPPPLAPVVTAADLQLLFQSVDRVFLHPTVADYIGRVIAATHKDSPRATPSVRSYVRYGASPRAAIAVAGTSRALALLRGKPNVGFDEVRDVLPSALAHRLVLDYTARIDGKDARGVVAEISSSVGELAEPLPAGATV